MPTDPRLAEIERNLAAYRQVPTEEMTLKLGSGASTGLIRSVIRHYGPVFSEWPFLIQNGHIVWGYVVMAHDDLSDVRDSLGMGFVAFSTEATTSEWPEALRDAAQRLHNLPEARDEEGRQWDQFMSTALGHPPSPTPPEFVAQGRPILVSALGIACKHLPGRVLHSPLLPLLWHESTRVVMVVPQWFWPESMVAEGERLVADQREALLEHTRERFERLTRWQRFKLGLGKEMAKSGCCLLLALKPLVIALALLMLAPSVARYHTQTEPVVVTTAAELAQVGKSKWVVTEGALDVARGVKHQSKSRTSLLAPVVGTDPPLWVQVGNFSPDQSPGDGKPCRLSGACDDADSFMYASERRALEKEGRPLPPGTRLIDVRPDPIHWWGWGLLGAWAVTMLVSLWVLRRLSRGLRLALFTKGSRLTATEAEIIRERLDELEK